MGCQQSNIILRVLDNFIKLESCNKCTLDLLKLVRVRQLIPDMTFVYNFPEKNKYPKLVLAANFIFLDNDSLKDELSASSLNLYGQDMFKLINNNPLTDLNSTVDNATAKQAIVKIFRNALPKPEIVWTNWNSNETLVNLVFSGLGQYYLQKTDKTDLSLLNNAAYKVDFSALYKYSVRENYEKYGLTAYFDAKRNPIAFIRNDQIFYTNHPSFNHLNLLFRSTLIIITTLNEHLIGCHWVVANSVLVNSMQYLGSTHVLRRFIRCHVYGTALTNIESTMLAPSNGIVCRLSAFDHDGWSSMITDGIAAFKYETIEEHFYASNLSQDDIDSLPYYKDGIELWYINKEYVSNFINIYYEDDNAIHNDIEIVEYWQGLKNYFTSANYNIGDLTKNNLIKHLTYFIFTVTAQHIYMGDLIEYVMDPDACAGKVLNHPSIVTIDFQTYMQQLILAGLTNQKMPQLLNSWTFLYDTPNITNDQQRYNALKTNLNMWQYKLISQSSIIDRRNITRFPFMAMNPRILESSVSF